MTACWNPVPADRPSMANVVLTMRKLCTLFHGADVPLVYEEEVNVYGDRQQGGEENYDDDSYRPGFESYDSDTLDNLSNHSEQLYQTVHGGSAVNFVNNEGDYNSDQKIIASTYRDEFLSSRQRLMMPGQKPLPPLSLEVDPVSSPQVWLCVGDHFILNCFFALQNAWDLDEPKEYNLQELIGNISIDNNDGGKCTCF
jgi:hypothetical protein